MLSTTLVLGLAALASAATTPSDSSQQCTPLQGTVVRFNETGVCPECLTTSQVIAVSPQCAQACQNLALQPSVDGCAFEDLTCHCLHNTAVGNVIGPCLGANSTCSPDVLTAFDNDFNALCAIRNATAASGKTPDCGNKSSSKPPTYTTSTVYSTSTMTITSCEKTVTNCPAHSTKVVTSVIAVSTTVCPVTSSSKPTYSTPGAPAQPSKPSESSPVKPTYPASSSPAKPVTPAPQPTPYKPTYNQTGNGTYTKGSGVTMFQGGAVQGSAVSGFAAVAGVALAALML